MALWRVLDKTSAPLRGAVKHRLTTRLNSVKRLNSKPRAEKESIRLTARTGEFTRIVERATESSAAQPSCAIKICLIAQNLSSRRKRGQLLLCNKHLFCSAGFLPFLVILRATRPCFLYSQ